MTTENINLDDIMSSDDIDLSKTFKPSYEGVIIATATNLILKDVIASDDIDLMK